MPKSIPIQTLTWLPVANQPLAQLLLQLGTDIAKNRFKHHQEDGGGLTCSVETDTEPFAPEDTGVVEHTVAGKRIVLHSDLTLRDCNDDPPSAAELLKILPTRDVLLALLDHCGLAICVDGHGDLYLKKSKNTKANLGMFTSDVLIAAIAEALGNG